SFARSDRETFGKTLELNELRYRDGKIAYGDVLKLRIQALTQDDAVRQAEQNLVAARADLVQLVGEDALLPAFQVQGSLEPPPQRSRRPGLRRKPYAISSATRRQRRWRNGAAPAPR